MQLTHYNYVAFIDGGLIKIGRTGDPQARMMRLARQARRCGREMLFIEGRPVPPWLALGVETAIRKIIKDHTLPGHFEWAMGDEEAADALVAMTRRFQDQVFAATEVTQ